MSVPTITSSGFASATQNQPFTYQIVATGSPTSYGASPLPNGLSINTGTGLISGTPTVATQTTVHLTASNGDGPGTKDLTLLTALPPLTFTVILLSFC